MGNRKINELTDDLKEMHLTSEAFKADIATIENLEGSPPSADLTKKSVKYGTGYSKKAV